MRAMPLEDAAGSLPTAIDGRGGAAGEALCLVLGTKLRAQEKRALVAYPHGL